MIKNVEITRLDQTTLYKQLNGYNNQLACLQGRGRAAGVVLKLKQGGHVQPHRCLRPGSAGCPARYLETAHLSLRPQGTEITLQVSVSHQLHHHQRWLAFGHHPQEADLWNKQRWGRFLNEGL